LVEGKGKGGGKGLEVGKGSGNGKAWREALPHTKSDHYTTGTEVVVPSSEDLFVLGLLDVVNPRFSPAATSSVSNWLHVCKA